MNPTEIKTARELIMARVDYAYGGLMIRGLGKGRANER
jgi:hypothetical protein